MSFTKSKVFFPLLSAILALYYTFPFLIKYNYWGIRDWDLFTTIAAVPTGTILYYHQFPFWNPYLAGGNILFHHPEVAVLSPFLLLYLIFGAVIGLKLQVLICYFLGFWGSFRLFSQLGISRGASIVAGVAYFGSVHFALHFAEGHMPFTHFCFLPWFIFFLLKANEDKRFLLGAALSIVLMVLGNGAAIPFLYTFTFSSVFFLLRAIQKHSLKEVKNFLAAVGIALGIAAIKLLPAVVYLVHNRWRGKNDETLPLTALGKIFFGLKHSLFVRNFPEQLWNWHEYGAYLSPLLVLLAGYALVKHFRKLWVWLGVVLFFLILGLGNFAPFSLWAILSELPGFYSARCTGRAFQFVILGTAVLGGFGIDLLWQKSKQSRYQKWISGSLTAAAGVIIATNLVLAYPIMSSSFIHPPHYIPRAEEFTHVVKKDGKAFENYLANRGSLIAPELSATKASRALVGMNDSVYMELVLSGQAEIVAKEYTPNRIEYEIIGRQPGEIVISMGYDPGWYAEDGRPLKEEQNLIAFPFTQGYQKVVLRYRPPYFFAGAAISLVTIVFLIATRRKLFSN